MWENHDKPLDGMATPDIQTPVAHRLYLFWKFLDEHKVVPNG